MNELEFEKELRKLRPAAPSRALEDLIASGLAECRAEEPQPAKRRESREASEAPVSWFTVWLDRLLWSGAGAAAAVMIVMIAQKPPTRATTGVPEARAVARNVPVLDSSSLQPVMASEEDLGWSDEGVQFDAQGQPMLKLRRMAVERKAFADLQNPGVIQVETPRQEVIWVPVTLH
jgi:hypothetical protein